jgi:hypothetical protein
MKIIIAGGRDFTDWEYFNAYMNFTIPPWIKIDEIVSGGAKGADALGEQFAQLNNIPLKVIPADWDRHGRKAGPIRNAEMGIYADGLVAFWDGKSTGTKHMIEYMKHWNKWACVVRTDIPWNKEWKLDKFNKRVYPILNNIEVYNETKSEN